MNGAREQNNQAEPNNGAVCASRNNAHASQVLSDEFAHLTKELRRKVPVDRCVLILKKDIDSRLAAVASWDHGILNDGLAINLPHDNSLFDKVGEDGRLYTENFCTSFSGNFFERKLLIDGNSQSFALQPLRHDGHLVGLVGMSSEKPMAFVLLEEGTCWQVMSRFAAVCDRANKSLWS
jgi:hypothetical protein